MRLPHRPRLALSFTVLHERDRVRLVAGEEFRYTLAGPSLDSWLPDWLPLLDGKRTVDEALAHLDPAHHESARQILDHLTGERVLVDGPVEAAHPGQRMRLVIAGQGQLRPGLESLAGDSEGAPLHVLCQDRLDLDEALCFNDHHLRGHDRWLWVSCAAMSRGYVSPVFLPDSGPCLACLLGRFRQLSPLPELYGELIAHGRSGGHFADAPFPGPAVVILQHLVAWKRDLLARTEPSAAVYRLHVLEVSSLETTAHPVLVDPECPACLGRR